MVSNIIGLSIFYYQYLKWVLMYKVCVKYTGNITIEVNETLQVRVANNMYFSQKTFAN